MSAQGAGAGNGPDGSEAFAAWRVPEGGAMTLYERVLQHPDFAAAGRLLAANMLKAAADDRAIDGVFKDAGRYIAALCAAALQDEGVTLPRLKALCAHFGMVGDGRVRALLLYMRYLGFVALWRENSGRAAARYAISPAFQIAWRAHLQAALEAASLVEPAAMIVAARLEDPRFLSIFCRVQLEGLAGSINDIDRESPFFRLFMHRHAGNQMTWSLLTQGETVHFPPEGLLDVSFGALAKRFGVSSIHVKRLFSDASREGFLMPLVAGQTRFGEAAADEIRLIYAAQIAQLLVACAQALERAEAPELAEA